MKYKFEILILFVFLLNTKANGQQGTNYTSFDHKKMHFGFALGANTSDFHYQIRPDAFLNSQDSILGIQIKRQPGFSLGIISSLDLHETVHFRFIPSLSFQERLFSYSYIKKGEIAVKENRLESTYLDFPILLKLRTKRIDNFAAYVISGVQYSLDLASQADVDQTIGEPIVKVKKHDYSYQIGGGFDFWLPYFKFGIELKLSNGFRNIHIQDDTFFMAPLGSLKSKVWTFSLTFEG